MKQKARVAIVGYGTIGKRAADAISVQDDMEVAGIIKRNLTHELYSAVQKGYPLFALSQKSESAFVNEGFTVEGYLHSLLQQADIAVIATPDGSASEYIDICRSLNLPVIIQGGEGHELAGISFNSEANYSEALGKKAVRVVSCNTTALTRALYPLDTEFGIKKVRATLIRRAADPNDIKTGPINALVPETEIPSHHGPDVNTIIPHLDITTTAIKASTTLMHLHLVNVELSKTASEKEVTDLLKNRPRIRMVSNKQKIRSTAEIMEFARDMGRPRGDMWENVIWEDSIHINGKELNFFEAVHQESIVIPENVDAIRSMLGMTNGPDSITKTNIAMGINR